MGHIRVDPPNTNNKWVGFGLANVNKWVIFVTFKFNMFYTNNSLLLINHPYMFYTNNLLNLTCLLLLLVKLIGIIINNPY